MHSRNHAVSAIASLLALALGCGGQAASTKPAAKPGNAGAVVRVDPDPDAITNQQLVIANLVIPSANAVTRTPFEHFAIATFVRDLIGTGAPCWADLERAVLAAYQIQTPGPSSYFVLEGSFDRATVERCVPTTFAGKVDVQVRKDGELAVFDMADLGSVYVAWRGRFVVVGEKGQVTAALQAPNHTTSPWPQRLAETTAAPVWQYRTDRMMESLFAATSTAYLVELDRLVLKPQPQFTGRVVIWYRSGSDAAVVGRRVRAGELSIQGTQGLVDAFRQMKVTQDGAKLTLGFDHGTFNLVDLDELLQLATRWAAGA